MSKLRARRLGLMGLGLVYVGVGGACGNIEEGEGLGTVQEFLCNGAVLTGNPPGPSSAGTSVVLSATAAKCGAGETPEYKFAFKRDGTTDAFTVIRDYGTSPSATWNTVGLPSGKYQVVVYTRSVGSTASHQGISYLNYLVGGVCTSGTLLPSPTSPQPVGSSVSLGATGTCSGGAMPEYRFMYRRPDQTTYTEIAPYGSSPVSWDTSGLPSGAYSLLVYIRGAGNASTSEGTAYANYQLGAVCSAASVSPALASPQQPGTTISLNGAADCGGSTPEYRFFYRGAFDSAYTEIRGYSTTATAAWDTTGLSGGSYTLMVQARSSGNSSAAEATGYFSPFKLGFSVTGVSAGAASTCVLLDSGAKCFGRNLLGAPTGQHSYDRGIEVADMGDSLPVVSLGSSRSAKAIARGANHACALLDNGTVKCWGSNANGALGLGDLNHRSAGANEMGNALPTVSLGSGRTAKSIAAGRDFSCALLDNGSVKCWGNNAYGSLGLGDTQHRGDSAGEMGDNLPAVNLGTGRTATALQAGMAHVCAILDDATLKCWGLNNYGQLGIGNGLNQGDNAGEMGDNLPLVDLGTGRSAVALALGGYHSCAILDDDSTKCWGYGAYGATGQESSASRGDDPGEMGDALPAVELGTGRYATHLAAGGHHTCAVLDNGTAKCWGYNVDGQLGLGHLLNRGDEAGEMGDALPAIDLGTERMATQVLATQSNSCAVLDNGTLKCWGAAHNGLLGIGPSSRRGDQLADMGDNLPSFHLGTGRSILSLGSGFSNHFACALLDDSTVKCWGSNSYGQLGINRASNVGDEPGDTGERLAFVSLGNQVLPTSVGSGEHHSCALLSDNTIKCWGANLYGTSGLGDTARHDGRASYLGANLPPVQLGVGRHPTALSVGANHACAILDNGSVKCWGQNSYGQLGLGDRNDRGDEPNEMGDALPAVDLGTGRTARALSLGYRHSCALLDDSSIKCWGYNWQGQLGLGSNTDRGDQPNEMGDALPAVALGTGRTAVSVVAGYSSTCATLDDGSTKCWGDNQRGQLGLGDKVIRGNRAGQMGDALPVVQLGAGRTAVQLSLGQYHTCALLDDQTVKCWGYGASGKLGYGDTTDRGDNPNEMGDNLPAVDFGAGERVTSLASGWNHNCVALAGGAGRVKCWGASDSGNLGLGDNVTRGDDAGEMGASLMSVDLGNP